MLHPEPSDYVFQPPTPYKINFIDSLIDENNIIISEETDKLFETVEELPTIIHVMFQQVQDAKHSDILHNAKFGNVSKPVDSNCKLLDYNNIDELTLFDIKPTTLNITITKPTYNIKQWPLSTDDMEVELYGLSKQEAIELFTTVELPRLSSMLINMYELNDIIDNSNIENLLNLSQYELRSMTADELQPRSILSTINYDTVDYTIYTQQKIMNPSEPSLYCIHIHIVSNCNIRTY